MPAFGAFSKTEIDVALAGTTTDDTPSVMNVGVSIPRVRHPSGTGVLSISGNRVGAITGCMRSINRRSSARLSVNGESNWPEVSAIRNLVLPVPALTRRFAASTACCHRVLPSFMRACIVGEVSRTMTVRLDLPVSHSISGRAIDIATSKPGRDGQENREIPAEFFEQGILDPVFQDSLP